MSLSREMRMHDAVQSGACEAALREAQMVNAILDACQPDISDIQAQWAEQDRIAARDYRNRWDAWAAANNQPLMEEAQ